MCCMLEKGLVTDNWSARKGARRVTRTRRTPDIGREKFQEMSIRADNPQQYAAQADSPKAYAFDPLTVAESLIARVGALADERDDLRRSLIRSVEMVETPGLDRDSAGVT